MFCQVWTSESCLLPSLAAREIDDVRTSATYLDAGLGEMYLETV